MSPLDIGSAPVGACASGLDWWSASSGGADVPHAHNAGRGRCDVPTEDASVELRPDVPISRSDVPECANASVLDWWSASSTGVDVPHSQNAGGGRGDVPAEDASVEQARSLNARSLIARGCGHLEPGRGIAGFGGLATTRPPSATHPEAPRGSRVTTGGFVGRVRDGSGRLGPRELPSSGVGGDPPS